MIQGRIFLILFAFLFSATFAEAGVRLPIHSLRDQADTSHCWAYAMGHLLETRALTRSAADIVLRVEKDVKYWVDYERMFYIYKSKHDFYLDDEYEGAWQIEFWETFLKYGKPITTSRIGTPDVWYEPMKPFNKHLPFVPEARPTPDPTLISVDQLKTRLLAGFGSDTEADLYIRDYLDRRYGRAEPMTHWMGASVAVQDTPPLVLGEDFATNQATEAAVLIKPVKDGRHGWVRYLDNRYWGYRYDEARVLELIRTSLDNQWPVTFDNGPHAMTIVGYEGEGKGTFYAVADSVPGQITWYSSADMLESLNLVTIFQSAIPGALPPRIPEQMAKLPPGLDLDRYDHVDVPPR